VDYFDNLTNTTITENLTYLITYDCELNIDNGTYLLPNGSTTNITDTITVNQTLFNPLSDGYYNLALDCVYGISMTNYNLSQYNITRLTQKNILIDTVAPIISLYDYSNTTLYNGTISLNFTITDLSTTNCTLNLDNITANIISNTSNVSIPFNLFRRESFIQYFLF